MEKLTYFVKDEHIHYKTLWPYFNKNWEGSAEELINFIENKIKDELENQPQILAIKDDLKRLELKISETKVDMIKWMFAFWVTIVLLSIGIYIRL